MEAITARLGITPSVIDKVLALFDGGAGWTQNHSGVDEADYPVGEMSDTAVRWCLWGGFARILGDSNLESVDLAYDLGLTFNSSSPSSTLTGWNDASERTYEDVERLLTHRRNELEAVGLVGGA